MPEAAVDNGVKVAGYTEIRNGICENCHIPMDVICTVCSTVVGRVDGGYHCPQCGDNDGVYRCPTCGGKKGELLVAFNSLEVEDRVGNEYQKERIIYCMKHRRDNIPGYLRTGGKLPLFKGKKGEAQRLKELNIQEVNHG